MDAFIKLAQAVGLVALDIGARGGVKEDLLRLAKAVDYYGFEPDRDECARLNQNSQYHPWKSLTFIPTALAATDGTLDLNLYRQRGCSSVLQARQDLGELFSRGDYYIHEGTAPIPARRLDTVVEEHPIKEPAFMKIDVQGMEVDCFTGAEKTLCNYLVGIRTEVSFFPMYEGQPLFAEVDQTLRRYNFVPMHWLELHEWRRTTRVKPPALSREGVPYSRGQMMHGDVLYLLHPESLSSTNDAEIKRLIRLGLTAICFDHIDHALAAFNQPGVREFCYSAAEVDPVLDLESVSRSRVKPFQGVRQQLRKIVDRLL